jgi:subtilisin family serine protease
MRRNFALAVLAFALLSAPSAHAAQRSPALAQKLATMGPNETVPVFLEFTSHPELSAYGRRTDGQPVIQALRANADESQARVLDFLRARGLGDRLQSFWINNSILVRVPASMISELESFSEIGLMELDSPVVGDGDPRPTLSSTEWNLPKVRATDVWNTYGLDGTGIVVGSMDTGFDPTHPAIASKWRGGTNSWKDMVNAGPSPYDDHGHGTHTIGTMVGGDGNGPFATDVGVAYNAKFISVKVLAADNSFNSSATVVGGAQWMLDPDGNPATNDFPAVINNSWGFFDLAFQGFHAAVDAWRAVGIIPVFSLGNSGPNASTSGPPGNYDNTIGVGATDISDVIASFSSRGPSPMGAGFPLDQRKPDVSAPGASVLSSVPGGFYQYWYGTSMAAPHVAGTIALMLQAHGNTMSFDEIMQILKTTSVDLGFAGYDFDYGYGRLDAFAAVTAAMAPSAHVTAAATGHDIQLSWNAVGGALHYNIYRSGIPQDPAPLLIGTTTGTAFTDAHRSGRFFYRLKTVSGSGPSPYTNETNATACPWSAPFTGGSDGGTSSPIVADLNGDGHADVALASLSTNTVKVALGNGTGGFGAITSYPAGQRPSGIAVGDWNADGIRDLAVTNNLNLGTVSILLGHGSSGIGDGTFGALVTYPTASRPIGVVSSDFDQDGIADLAVACNGAAVVSILRGNGTGGNGDGTFGAPVNYATSQKPTSIVASDWNADGAVDLAVTANGSARVSVLLGNKSSVKADGTFTVGTPAFCAINPVGLATGDFNGDGMFDLAVACASNPGVVAIMFGRVAGPGESVFADGIEHPAGTLPQGIASLDLNGDGITDLVAADGVTDGPILGLLGTGAGGVGDGGFESTTSFKPGGSPSDLVVADLDGDGSADLATANVVAAASLGTLLGSCDPELNTGLTLVSPNGGQSWAISTTQTISWTKGPGVISVNIDVSRDNGATWRSIATQQIGTSFAWSVTDPQTGTAAARIRVSDSRVSSTDMSDAPFTILPDYRLDVPAGPRADARLAMAVENPSVNGLRVRFSLAPSPSTATLDVVDLSGRRRLAFRRRPRARRAPARLRSRAAARRLPRAHRPGSRASREGRDRALIRGADRLKNERPLSHCRRAAVRSLLAKQRDLPIVEAAP